MFEQITNGDFPMPASLSPECQDLLRQILNPNPTQRITIDEILAHPWLFGIGNVFPAPKKVEETVKEPRLNLSLGGFSSSNLRPGLAFPDKMPSGLETIYEDGVQPQLLAVIGVGSAL